MRWGNDDLVPTREPEPALHVAAAAVVLLPSVPVVYTLGDWKQPAETVSTAKPLTRQHAISCCSQMVFMLSRSVVSVVTVRPKRTASSCLPLSCPKGELSGGSSDSNITLQEEGILMKRLQPGASGLLPRAKA